MTNDIPTEEYGPEDAKRAMERAELCVETAKRLIEGEITTP